MEEGLFTVTVKEGGHWEKASLYVDGRRDGRNEEDFVLDDLAPVLHVKVSVFKENVNRGLKVNGVLASTENFRVKDENVC